MLIIDKDTARRVDENQESEYYFHAHDEGFTWSGREAQPMQTEADQKHLPITEGGASVTGCEDYEAANGQETASENSEREGINKVYASEMEAHQVVNIEVKTSHNQQPPTACELSHDYPIPFD